MPEPNGTTPTGGAAPTPVQQESGAAPSAPAPDAVQPQATAGAAEGAALQSKGSSVDLDALLTDPKVREELERRLVKPAISKVEFNRRQLTEQIEAEVRQRLTAEQLQAQQATLIQQARSSDPKVAGEAKARLGELALHQFENQRQERDLQTQRQQMQAEIARSLATTVFGAPADDIPADALASPEALRDWALTQSTVVKEAIAKAIKQAESDAKAVEQASAAGSFAAKLAATPNPTFDQGSGAPTTSPGAMTQQEFDRHRSNRAWLQENWERFKAGRKDGLITY